MSWLVPRGALTDAQSRVVQSGAEQHRLVLGSPGSGKTVVLLHRARYLIEKYGIRPERFRLLVFTNALKKYIHAALRDLALPNECAVTFDAWCRRYHRMHIGKRLPWNDHEAIRQVVWQHTRSLTASNRPLDFVMVDEGQDLNRRDFETLAAVAAHVTVFMDPKQKIHDGDADEAGVAQALDLRRRNHSLLNAYRCSPYIVQAGAAFIRGEVERQQFIKQNCAVEEGNRQGRPVEEGQRQLPLLYLASDTRDEMDCLKQVILTRINRSESIAILFPSRNRMSHYARELQAAGLEVEVKNRFGANEADALPDIDFNTSVPKLMPYPSAKGLTFDTVLMPSLTRGSFEKKDPGLLERWLFVGITRATRWIYISTTDGDDMLFLDRFRQLAQRKQLTIQRGKEPRPAKPAPPAPDDASGGEGDLSDMF